MQPTPFRFLLETSESQGQEWLTRYLMNETPNPRVPVPSDIGRLEFLLGEVNPIPELALPLRVGDLAGALLAKAVMAEDRQLRKPDFLKALFTLVESLPVSENVVEFLNMLAISGRLVSWPPADTPDFHLLTLRSLVSHQRPVADDVNRLIDFWKREAQDLRYASISIQGLLRVAPRHAVQIIPDFVDRVLNTPGPMPFANLLFAVSIELGADLQIWQHLVRVLRGDPRVFGATKEGFSRIQLARNNPEAWKLFEMTPSPERALAPEETLVLSIMDPEVQYRPALAHAA